MSSLNSLKSKDNQWLQVDVCSEFMIGKCIESTCNLAHPSANVEIVEGKVVSCFDSLRDKCRRSSCKFYHPSDHLIDLLFSKTKQSAKVKSHTQASNVHFVTIDKFPQAQQQAIAYQSPIQIASASLFDVTNEAPNRVDKRCAENSVDAIAETFYPSIFLKRVPIAHMPYSCFPNFMSIPSSSGDIMPAIPMPLPVQLPSSECKFAIVYHFCIP